MFLKPFLMPEEQDKVTDRQNPVAIRHLYVDGSSGSKFGEFKLCAAHLLTARDHLKKEKHIHSNSRGAHNSSQWCEQHFIPAKQILWLNPRWMVYIELLSLQVRELLCSDGKIFSRRHRLSKRNQVCVCVCVCTCNVSRNGSRGLVPTNTNQLWSDSGLLSYLRLLQLLEVQ